MAILRYIAKEIRNDTNIHWVIIADDDTILRQAFDFFSAPLSRKFCKKEIINKSCSTYQFKTNFKNSFPQRLMNILGFPLHTDNDNEITVGECPQCLQIPATPNLLRRRGGRGSGGALRIQRALIPRIQLHYGGRRHGLQQAAAEQAGGERRLRVPLTQHARRHVSGDLHGGPRGQRHAFPLFSPGNERRRMRFLSRSQLC